MRANWWGLCAYRSDVYSLSGGRAGAARQVVPAQGLEMLNEGSFDLDGRIYKLGECR